MTKFRKKPVVIEAEQFFANRKPWPKRVFEYLGAFNHWIYTLEGSMSVSNGDWIITGVKGEKYPCKPDIFEMTYELVPSETVGTAFTGFSEEPSPHRAGIDDAE